MSGVLGRTNAPPSAATFRRGEQGFAELVQHRESVKRFTADVASGEIEELRSQDLNLPQVRSPEKIKRRAHGKNNKYIRDTVFEEKSERA